MEARQGRGNPVARCAALQRDPAGPGTPTHRLHPYGLAEPSKRRTMGRYICSEPVLP